MENKVLKFGHRAALLLYPQSQVPTLFAFAAMRQPKPCLPEENNLKSITILFAAKATVEIGKVMMLHCPFSFHTRGLL